ncbi:secondary thiamine-phosphate synthase enzyme YjbQ [Hyphomicrobium sp. LHD-15]|uniref:secondary thiamine-phosphate synthase enzyme YjbQ n=1 Tax=Hyphomicrobium sp. LHD-15 TaxID=3072142 RepID=UPI00280DD0BB|nr:secondary thiamine-phosphate synthase enzyme YjbQ [Hyphomicrobium sp. LHD-15]MDQ8700279.1 secondary thiamine-phosphate synthase enzyme YjbQ [Hyphomicrobium sp. LHD-15]
MQQAQKEIIVTTDGQGLYEISEEVRRFAKDAGIRTGQLTAYCRHTSASLVIQENADPDVRRDLIAFFQRLVPDGDPLFVHTLEGDDDMPAHVKSALTQTSITIPIMEEKLALGTWQGLYLFEHRNQPHARKIVLHVIGA